MHHNVEGARVYVINKGSHDYSAAEKYGEIVYICEELVDREDTNLMYLMVDKAMRDSTPDDYIVIGSLTGMCSIAAGYMAARHGEVNFLIHQRGEYIERRVVYD